MEAIHIPLMKIKPNSVSFYSEKYHTHYSYSPETDALVKKNERMHNGNLSEAAQKNLLDCVERFYFFLNRANNQKRAKKIKSKRSLKLITLTLASKQEHSDNTIRKELLNQFLTELREKFALKNYIWKAEKQGNGNLHFHIITDIFIPHTEIRQIWNRIQNKLGYVNRFRDNITSFGFDFYFDLCRYNNPQIDSDIIINRWKKGQAEKWSNPPGTEIRQVEKVRKLRPYFAKYFGKACEVEPGFGRIWFASRSLTQEIYFRVTDPQQIDSMAQYLKTYFSNKLRQYDYASIFWVNFNLYQYDTDLEIVRTCRNKFDEFSKEFW